MTSSSESVTLTKSTLTSVRELSSLAMIWRPSKNRCNALPFSATRARVSISSESLPLFLADLHRRTRPPEQDVSNLRVGSLDTSRPRPVTISSSAPAETATKRARNVPQPSDQDPVSFLRCPPRAFSFCQTSALPFALWARSFSSFLMKCIRMTPSIWMLTPFRPTPAPSFPLPLFSSTHPITLSLTSMRPMPSPSPSRLSLPALSPLLLHPMLSLCFHWRHAAHSHTPALSVQPQRMAARTAKAQGKKSLNREQDIYKKAN